MTREDVTSGWAFKKEFNWGHVLTALPIIGALFTGYVEINGRINVNSYGIEKATTEIAHLRELNSAAERQLEKAIADMKAQFEKIDKKLDNLLERELNRGR